MNTTTTRSGVTPVIAIVLLLMMTVAAAGGAFAWYEQMSGEVMGRANAALNTEISVRNLQCDATLQQITLWVKNTGRQEILLNQVDLFVEDSSGNLVGVVEDMPWNGAGFSQPGGIGKVVIDFDGGPTSSNFIEVGGTTSSDLSGFTDAPTLTGGGFYDVEFDVSLTGSGRTQTINAGSCTAQ